MPENVNSLQLCTKFSPPLYVNSYNVQNKRGKIPYIPTPKQTKGILAPACVRLLDWLQNWKIKSALWGSGFDPHMNMYLM